MSEVNTEKVSETDKFEHIERVNTSEVAEIAIEQHKNDSKIENEKLLLDKLHKLNTINLKLEDEKDELLNKISNLEKIYDDLKNKFDRSQQHIDNSKKELQSMVMKYATSEREVLNIKKFYSENEKKFKDSLKERDQLQIRIKELENDKKQLLSSVEKHVLEAAHLQTDLDLAKNRLEQSHIREDKLKLQFEKLSLDYNCLKTKMDFIDDAISKLPKSYQKHEKYSLNDEDDYNVELLPQQETENCSNSIDINEKNSSQIENRVDYTALFQQILETNNRYLKEKDYLHAQNCELESRIEELQNRLADATSRVDDYDRKLKLIDELKQEMINKQNVVDCLKSKFDQINSINRSLVGDIDSSKSKESELLDYTERLTAKLVSLQSGSNDLQIKLKELEKRWSTLQNEHDLLMSKKVQLQTNFDIFQQEAGLKEQNSNIKIDKLSSENMALSKKIEELENDLSIAKKKHLSALKEMSCEIQKLRKTQCITTDVVTNSSLSSRTGSVSSLNNESSLLGTIGQETIQDHAPIKVIESQEQNNISLKCNDNISQQNIRSLSNSDTSTAALCDTEIITSLAQIKKSVLIEKLLKLQRILVKRKEKIDFLEEHSEQLTQNIRNKTKLLQNYILKEETGALSTDSMDQNKAYLSKRGGGIMSSLYNSFSTDDSMTLERSLEINAKLHALLEDTLLKNMTLKENLNTLAAEIERLSSK